MGRNYNELRAKMSPERRARVEARVQKTLAEMARKELSQARHPASKAPLEVDYSVNPDLGNGDK